MSDTTEPDDDNPPAPVRRRSPLGGIVLLVALLVAGGWVTQHWWWPAPQPEGPKSLGPLPNCISFSPDRAGKYLAVGFSDGRLGLWESATKREIPAKLPSQWPLNDLAWMPDGNSVLTGGFEQHVLMWNLKSNKAGKLPKFDVPIVSLAVRPGKPDLLVSLSNGELVWMNLQSGERASVPTGHTGVVKIVRYRPNGESFVTGGADGQLVWHDAEKRQITVTVKAHEHELSSLGFSNNGERLVTGSWDNTAKAWPSNGTTATFSMTHPDGVAQVAWQNAHIVTTCWDGYMRSWNGDSGSPLSERDCHSKTLTFAVWPGHEEVAEIEDSGALRLQRP